jgi:squalene-associated FAD-dependent desaturase
MGWQLHRDCTVSELLDRFEQTDRLTQLMWRPLCIAALNTPPERASAKVFLAVLRDSLGASRAASDMLLPRTDLSALFPDAAIAWLQNHGGKVMLGNRVSAIHPDGDGWKITSEQHSDHYEHVVIATSASHAQSLVLGMDSALAETLNFEYEAITTCYLQYAPTVRLPASMLALRDDPDSQRWGQFVFDRGQLDDKQAGLLAVVISASGTATESGTQSLETSVAQQLAHDLQMPEMATPLWSKAITEKRATFACTPDLQRPLNTTAHRGLWLAGDYTESEYPATIEGAVRSGLKVAAGIRAEAKVEAKAKAKAKAKAE